MEGGKEDKELHARQSWAWLQLLQGCPKPAASHRSPACLCGQGDGDKDCLSWQIQGMCTDRSSILVSPGPAPCQIWWHCHLPNHFPTLLQGFDPKPDGLFEPVLQHGSTDPVCCCSGVGIRGQERHLFKAVLSLKPPLHQTLAQEYKKMILCCCLVLAKIQTLLSEKLCAPASHFLSFLLSRHLFIIQNQKPGD